MQAYRTFLLLLISFLSIYLAYGQRQPLTKAAKDTVLPKVDSLKAAVVTAITHPRMKHDTLEYNTTNIKMRPNSSVEDLLARLPGLQIDANGVITFNGEVIQRLLVDGEDIFASDPTLITRNFDASKIARIQLLERKTDQAIFTGVDDGSRVKTLNLVLKDDAKNGYFGKVEAGGSTAGYYAANGALAAFRDKEQLTALALSGNTGVLGMRSVGGGGSGSIFFSGVGADPMGTSAGIGIPSFTAAALHYGNYWNGRREHLTANYQYSSYFTQPVTTTQTLQTEEDTIYGQLQQSRSVNSQQEHRVDGTYEWAPDERSAFRLQFNGSRVLGDNQFSAISTGTFNGTLVNGSQREIRDKLGHTGLGSDIFWRTSVGGLAGRLFSVNAGFHANDRSTDGYLYSLDRFYQPGGGPAAADTIDERKQLGSHALKLNSGVSYTQPVCKGSSIAVDYAIGTITDDPLQLIFDRGNGKYQNLVDSISSRLKTRFTTQQAGIDLSGEIKGLSYTLGNSWLDYSYTQHDLLTHATLTHQYNNWTPHIFLNYLFNPATFLHFSYAMSAEQPSAAQLQPVINNNDPLHISIGDPDLKPALGQDYRLEFHRLKELMVNMSLDLTFVSNGISTKIFTDTLGRQVSEPFNIGGGRTGKLDMYVGKKILGVDLTLHAAGNYARVMSYIDGALSRNEAYTGGLGFSLNKYVPDRYNLQLNTDLTYFDQVSSIDPTAPIHYWTQSHIAAVTLYFIKYYAFNTNATYTWQERTGTFAGDNSVFLWNGYLSRNLIGDRLVIKFMLNNILDQKTGISRSNAVNINTSTSTNILGRYWMFSAAWHFDKKFKRK